MSSKDQEESGFSLPAQEKILREYALRKGFVLTEKYIYRISETASKKNQRKLFNEMLQTAIKDKINILIFEKTDRVTRNFKDAVQIYEWLESDEKRELHCVKDSLVLSKNARSQDKLNFDIRVAMAKNYTDNLSEEVKKGRKQKAEEGRFPGPPKFGYISSLDKKKEHILNPDIAPLLRHCFEVFSTGNFTLRSFTEEAYRLGLKTKTNRKIAKSTWHHYLTDPYFYGDFKWEGKLYKGIHEPLIDKEIFDKIQAILTRKPDGRYNKHFSTFKGLIRCGECDGILSWYMKKGVMYGRCNHYKPCNQKICAKEKDIDNVIIEVFSSFNIKNERLKEWIRNALAESNKTDSKAQEISQKTLHKELERIEHMFNILYEDRLSGLIDLQRYSSKKEEFESNKCKILNRLKNLSQDQSKQRETNLRIFDMSQYGNLIYSEANVEEKRNHIKLMFSSVTFKDGIYSYMLDKRFEILLNAVTATNSSKLINKQPFSNNNFEQSEKLDITATVVINNEFCPTWLDRMDVGSPPFGRRERTFF